MDDLLTTQQVGERYGVQADTVSRWCQRGLFPNMRLGPKTGRGAIYLIPASDLEGFVPPQPGRPSDAAPSAAAAAQRKSRQRRRSSSTTTPGPAEVGDPAD